MSPDPRPDAEQVEVVARLVWNPEDYGAYEPNERDRDHARVILNALSAAGIPVGPVAALDYAEKLLLSDEAVEKACALGSFNPDVENHRERMRNAIRGGVRSARGEGT